MNRHYMEMEVEPTFTFSGTAADVTPYQQQIDQMRGELEAYVSASNGLPDPGYVRQQQTSIARLQAALDTLPAEAQINSANMQGALSRTGTSPTSLTQSELPQIPEEERSMLERSLNQIVLGNFSDDVTLLGTLGQFLLGLTGADVLLDARDLAYDLTHLNEVSGWQVLADAVGLIPVIGALKNVDEVAALVKAFRQGENLLGNLGDGARAGSRLALAGAGAAENAGTLNRVSEGFNAAADTARASARMIETGETGADAAEAASEAFAHARLTDEVAGSSAGRANLTKTWTEGENLDNIGIKNDEDLSAESLGRFSSEELLQKHFAKHKGKYGSITASEYVRQANALASETESDDVVQLLRSDGSVSRYRFSTNDFVVTNSDGTIRTFFKPTKGKEYWQDELNRNK